jgi:opacity protein-like surface antigen
MDCRKMRKRKELLLTLALGAALAAPAHGQDWLAPPSPYLSAPFTPPPAALPSPDAPPPDPNPWSGLTIGSEVFGISGRGLKSHVGGGGFAEWSRYNPDGSFVAFSGGAGFSPGFFPTAWTTGTGWSGYDFTRVSVKAGQDFGRLKTFVIGDLELAKPSTGPAGAPNAMGSIDNVFSAPSRLRARGAVGAGFEYQVTDQVMVGATVSASQGRGPFLPPPP